MNSKVVKTSHGIIEYTLVGNGIPILFLHGGHSNCNETLCHKGFDLNRFQLITPSRPGYGRTLLYNNESPYQTADLIVSLLDTLSIDKVIVYGISAGGLAAIEFAGNFPERTKKLVLASAVSKKWLEKNSKIYKTAKNLFNPKVEKLVWSGNELPRSRADEVSKQS